MEGALNGKQMSNEDSSSTLTVYPHYDDPQLQSKICRKMEFLQYAKYLPPNLRPSYITSSPTFFHQDIVKIRMSASDRLFVVHAPGSGKSCTAARMAQYLKDNHEINPFVPNKIKKMYILERSDILTHDIKKQIVDICVKDVYRIGKSDSDSKLLKLEQFFEVITYTEFINLVLSSDTSLFNDTVIVADEAHRFNNVIIKNDEDEIEMEDEISKKNLTRDYNILKQLFETIVSSKIIIMTATPMTNRAKDFSKLANLVLPADKQIPLKFDYDNVTFDTLNPYIRGIMSYVEPKREAVNIITVGDILPVHLENGTPSRMRIYRTEMKGIQMRTYEAINVKLRGIKTDPVHITRREISSIVYPDGSYAGKKGMTSRGLYKYVKKVGGKYIMNAELREALNIKNIGNYSSIFEAVIKNELDPPNRIVTLNGKSIRLPGNGCSFYFFDLVVSQTVPFTMALEANGFERFTEDMTAFDSGNRLVLGKKSRYILIDGDNGKHIGKFQKIFNSKENMHGEYVQIIVGSKVIKDGVNIFNISRSYISTMWNYASLIQALARALRAIGHDNLVEYVKNEFIKIHGMSEEDVSNYKYNMYEYKMSAYMPYCERQTTVNVELSVDEYMYINLIEEKEVGITKVMDIVRQSAFDRNLNTDKSDQVMRISSKYMNIEGDVPEHPRDNREAALGPLRDDLYDIVDYSTFDGIHWESCIEMYMNVIVNTFRSGSYEYAYEKMKAICYSRITPLLHREVYIMEAIRRLKDGRLDMRDRFNNVVWLSMDKDRLYISSEDVILQEEYSSIAPRIASIETFYKNIVLFKPKTIKDKVEEYYSNNVNKFKSLPFETLTPYVRSLVVQNIIEELITSEPRYIRDASLWYLEDLQPLLKRLMKVKLFVIKDPIEDIKMVAELMSLPARTKGRKPKAESRTKIKDVKFKDPALKGGPIAIINIVGSELKSLNIKISRPNVSGKISWITPKPFEGPVYEHIIDELMDLTPSGLRDGELFGFIDLDGKFMISRKSSSVTDKRLTNSGQNCVTINKKKLINIWKELGGEDLNIDEVNKDDLCRRVKERMYEMERLVRL